MSTDSTELPFGLPIPEISPRRELEALLHVDPDSAHRVEVGIPMRDGVELAADVFLPPVAQRPAPAVVIGTPYDKSTPFEQGEPWQEAGYVAVVYDSRGRGKSEGEWHPHARDGLDGHDVVEWSAAQQWCDGKVGVTGISYLGWVVWSTMAERPPHLRAAISTAPEGRWQEEIPYTYGCFWLYYAMWYSLVRRRILDHSRDVGRLVELLPMEAVGEAVDSVGPGWREMMEHDTLDELFRSRRWEGEYEFDVPCLQVGGWHDRECVQATLYHYEEMMACSPAREQQWLLMGPWSHSSARHPAGECAGVEYPDAAIDMTAIHIRFFDHFLRGADNGVSEEPRVRLYDTGAKRWRALPAWQGGTRERSLFLAPGEALDESPAAAGEMTYRYDPLEPAGIRFDVAGTFWEPPLDLAELEAQDGVVTWTSSPLERPLTFRGWGGLELWAATDGEDTEWHAKLADVAPDGCSLMISWGCLRASYGEDASHPAPVVPGEARRYEIELTPAFHTFQPGHRIRVVLASSEYPWFARSMNRFGSVATADDPRAATNTVLFGPDHLSRLRLPIEEDG